MIKRILIALSASFLFLACQTHQPAGSTSPSDAGSHDEQRMRTQKNLELTNKIQDIFKDSQLPSLQAYVVHRSEILFRYSSGIRAVGFDTPVTDQDIYFLGIGSKSMTSILIGQLIDQKIIDWTTTVGSVLSKHKMHPSIKSLTIETLLNHNSGLAAPETLKIWNSLYDKKYTTQKARELLVEAILSQPAHFSKGTSPEYNSSGYILLGAIIENLTNFSWEELVQNKILNPLGMKSCIVGFYNKEKTDKPVQPWPHEATDQGYKALDAHNPKSDFPPAFAAAGNLRCNGEDWIRFLMEMNYGLFKASVFLEEKTFLKLFNTKNDKNINLIHFGVSEQIWGGGNVFFNIGVHDSSVSFSTIVPRRESALVVFTNAGDKNATKTTNSVLKLLKEYVESEQ